MIKIVFERKDLEELSEIDDLIKELADGDAERVEITLRGNVEAVTNTLQSQGWGGVTVTKEETSSGTTLRMNWSHDSRGPRPRDS